MSVEINGTNLSTYGWSPRTEDDLLSTPDLSYSPITMPDRPGARAGLRQTGTKAFSIEGLLESTSLANARANLDAIHGLVTRIQPSTVIIGWSTTRRLVAECLGVDVEPLGPLLGLFKYSVTLNFDAPNPPFWQGTTQHSVAVTSTANVDLPMGNAPVWPQIRVQGSATSGTPLTISMQNSTSAIVKSIGFAVTLSTAQYLCIDMDKMNAYTNVTGEFSSGTSVIGSFVSGDFFAVLPEHGNVASSSFAKISLNTTGAMTVLYFKAHY